MCNSIIQNKLQNPCARRSRDAGGSTRVRVSGTFVCLTLLLASLAPSLVEAGFPHRRAVVQPRVEGPVVPAPKNWGYRPTRWIRWETDIIHPSIGPIPADTKQESKQAEESEDASGEDQSGTAAKADDAKKSTGDSPISDSVLPPLPSDDSTLPPLPNLDEDLPPLPGEDFKKEPSGSSQETGPDTAPLPSSPATPPQGPQGPAFRDPDASFAPSSTTDKPSDNARPVPSQKQGGPIPTKPETKKPATKPNPPAGKPAAPASEPPKNKIDVPLSEPKKDDGSAGDTRWEKRTREKPAPADIKKAAPDKKPGEPFYDPDSIFDERAARMQHNSNRWQKAGTTREEPQATHQIERNTRRMPKKDGIFSPITLSAPAQRRTAGNNQKTAEAVQPAQQNSFPEQDGAQKHGKRQSNASGSWKQAGTEAAAPRTPRIDHAVRPTSFEAPITPPTGSDVKPVVQSNRPEADRPPSAAPVAVTVESQPAGPLPQRPPADFYVEPQKSEATTIAPKAPLENQNLRVFRNPMRDPSAGDTDERVSGKNPLRASWHQDTAADLENKRSNPLR